MNSYKEGSPGCRTFVDVLSRAAGNHPERLALTFLHDRDGEETTFTYQALHERASRIAERLRSRAQPGDRALLVYPASVEFLAAFFGCLYAGVVAVPISPPRPNRPLPARLVSVLNDAQPHVVLTTAALHQSLEDSLKQTPHLTILPWIATDAIAETEAGFCREAAPSDVAFLQYTSGSSAAPKGVVVTHDNLVLNSRIIQKRFSNHEGSRVVSWLPLYHDMGLIGGTLQPLFIGGQGILMSPFAFLQRPVRWLQAISRKQGTTSGAPNFAYDFCARQVRPEQLTDIDLSSWTLAFTGAEPIRAETIDLFTRTFAPYGFRREVFYPCYGLAEATLYVTGGLLNAGPVVESFDTEALARGEAVASKAADARSLVGCGQCPEEQLVRIVDPDTRQVCPPDGVGEIWVSGPCVAQGYWNRPLETEQAFDHWLGDEGPFLRTGDLGFIRNGELFVAGRLKDLIIVRGRNLHPQDLEWSAQCSHAALRPDAGAAFTIDDGGDERLVIVQELERAHRKAAPAEIIAAIRHALAEQHDVQVHEVVLVSPFAVPKTSSGKIQRRACRESFLNGELDVIEAWSRDRQRAVAASLS